MSPALDDSFGLPPDTVAFYVDHQAKRSRASTFFRYPSIIGLQYYVAWWAIAAIVLQVIAWFAIIFTGKFPPSIYDYLVRFNRYSARVHAYTFLLTEKFPQFNGNGNEEYPAHFLIGPPKEKFSRWKALLRIVLAIPFYIVATVLLIGLLIIVIVDWIVIMVIGEQPSGIQNASVFCSGYFIRFNAWFSLLTEDWPKFSDEAVARSLQERGFEGSIPIGSLAASPDARIVTAAPSPPTPPTS